MSRRNRLRRNQDFFANIPLEIIINVLSRLPIRTIISCKCVCKSWLVLLETDEFVKLHLLKGIPGLSVYISKSKLYEVFEFEDGLDLERHHLHYELVTNFNFPYEGWISSSANGLLLLCNTVDKHAFYICNPITRDYIELVCPQEFVESSFDEVFTCGFGVSEITGQHKVIWILQDDVSDYSPKPPKLESVCHVYTIGTGSWRRIPPVTHLAYRCSVGAFMNGNLHWLVSDLEGPRLWISCFDLETEQFSTFSSPLLGTALSFEPSVLGDCLCLCDYNSVADGIDIWLMKEYGVETLWTKQFFIARARPLYEDLSYNVIKPIKVFKDGDILLVWNHEYLFYSKKNKTVQKVESFEPHGVIDIFLYTLSFLSLKRFGTTENVNSFGFLCISECQSVVFFVD